MCPVPHLIREARSYPARLPARAPAGARLAAAVAFALLVPAAAPAASVFKLTAHARLGEAPPADRTQVRGACILCHGRPAQARARGGRPHEDPCLGCHTSTGKAGSFQGPVVYEQSSHGPRFPAVWPGPKPAARPPTDAGRCVNCHAPHGAADEGGLIPGLLAVRGEALCLACHGAGARFDVATSRAKPFRHPAAGTAESAVGAGAPRTASCADCHNPHVAGDAGPTRAPEAPSALQGVARVRVANGPAGSAPIVAAVSASERTRPLEYEICLRCHSGAAGLPPGSPDLGLLLNPANPSHHPVEARGRNAGIDRRAFASGWSSDSLVRCTDCHGGDGPEDAGVHGSSWAGLLKRRHLAAPGFQSATREDLCFACHAWEAYVEPSSATRFGAHASHATAGAGCWSCHDSHGSPTLPALLALRSPGLTEYRQAPGGGTCSASCHVRTAAAATYVVAYPR